MRRRELGIVLENGSRFDSFQVVDSRIGVHYQHVVTQEFHILVWQVNLFDLLAQISYELCLVFIGILIGELSFTIQHIHSDVVAWIELIVLMDILINQFGYDSKHFCLWQIA